MLKGFEINFEITNCVWIPKSEVLRVNEHIRFAQDSGLILAYAKRAEDAKLIGRVPAYVGDMIRPYLHLGIDLDTAYMGADADNAIAYVGVRVTDEACRARELIVRQLHNSRNKLEMLRSSEAEFWAGVESGTFRV